MLPHVKYDADLNFQESTRAAHEDFDDKIETIMVSNISKLTKFDWKIRETA